MSKPLYRTARWKRKRDLQLKRCPLCVYCQQQGRTTLATVVDHVIPHRGDRHLFWQGELQSLCVEHHSSSKQSEERRGYARAVGIDGVPIDPLHPVNMK